MQCNTASIAAEQGWLDRIDRICQVVSIYTPIYYMVSWAFKSVAPKCDRDQFGCFCPVCRCDQHVSFYLWLQITIDCFFVRLSAGIR